MSPFACAAVRSTLSPEATNDVSSSVMTGGDGGAGGVEAVGLAEVAAEAASAVATEVFSSHAPTRAKHDHKSARDFTAQSVTLSATLESHFFMTIESDSPALEGSLVAGKYRVLRLIGSG